jgi:hypothetical protein
MPQTLQATIIDLAKLNEDCLEVYRVRDGANETLVLHGGNSIISLGFPEIIFAVTDILG